MTDINNLSTEERLNLMRQLAEAQAEEVRQKREALETYKELASDAVEEAFDVLLSQSDQLAKTKRNVYNLFKSVLEMKGDLFKVKRSNQMSNTFINKDNSLRITLGTYTLDNYDDTANDGIAMVNEYLDSLAENNPNAEQAVDICRSLMARGKKGNLKPSKIVTLYKHAQKSDSTKFREGVEIIMSAYNPTPSKTYIRAEYKTDTGQWKAVPLGITEAEE